METGFFLKNFHIKPEFDCIEIDGEVQKIEPKVMEVLVFLAAHQGHVISTETLIEKVWPDTIVSPQSVHRCISKLRKIFAADKSHTGYIKTYPKKGYSLEFKPERYTRTSETKPIAPLSIAVVPVKKHWLVPLFATLGLLLLLAMAGFWLHQQGNFSIVASEPSRFAIIADDSHHYQSIRVHPDLHAVAAIRKTNQGAELLIEQNKKLISLASYPSGNAKLALSWAPNGQQLAVAIVAFRSTKIIVYSFNSDLTKIVQQKVIYSSPRHLMGEMTWIEATKLLFTLSLNSQAEYYLYRINPETGAVYSENFQSQVSFVRHFHNTIAVVKKDYRQNHIIISDEHYQPIHQLTIQQPIGGISWLPDGTGIIYSSNNTIFEWNFKEKTAKKIAHSSGYISDIELLDESSLLYIDVIQNLDIRKHTFGKFTNTALVTTPNQDQNAIYANDSDDFAYISEVDGIEQVFLFQNGKTQVLTQFSNPEHIDSITWSTNDAWLLIQRGQEVLLYSFAIGSSNVILSNNLFLDALGLAQDHQHVFYRDSNTAPVAFWQYSILDGTTEKLAIPASSQAITINGEICYQKRRARELYCLTEKGAKLITNQMAMDAQFISSNSHYLYYFLYRPNHMKHVYRLNTLTGEHLRVIERGTYAGTVSSVRNDEYLVTYDEPLSRQIKELTLRP